MLTSVSSSPATRMARFALTPPGVNFREPQATSNEPQESVILSGASPAERREPASLGSTGWKVGLFLGLSMLGFAGVAQAGPPQKPPVTQSQPRSKAHEAGRKLNQTGKEVAKPFVEAGKEIGKAGKEFGLGVRDFFKGLGGK